MRAVFGTGRIARSVGSVCILCLGLVAGCDRESAATKVAGPLPPPVFGQGVVRGTVTLKGEPPAMRAIDNGRCHAGAKPIVEETVVVGPGGRLKNAVVYLKGVPASAATQPPAELDQVDCRYVPHVVALQVGQVLRVKTSDPAMHNVHAVARRNEAVNFAMAGGSSPRELTFGAAEVFAVKCDVHPWMLAHVAVFEHPFFAVTGDDGAFEVKGVPHGQYTLACWHEALGELEQPVTVKDGQIAAAAEFVYEKPE